MPFVSYDQHFRSVLAVCDRCDAVLANTGRVLGKKAHEAGAEELSPHFNDSASLLSLAAMNGWGTAGRIVCPACLTGRRSGAPHA